MTSLFVVSNPEVDFHIIDGGSTGPFDGLGDRVFSSFNTVVLGTQGEAANLVEFDISSFVIPSGEVITEATVEVLLTSLQVGGLGVGFGQNPNNLGIYGYVGNGIAQASDLEAGEFLNSIEISSAVVGDVLTFDVTPFIQVLSSNNDSFAGFGFRAQEFGGLAIREFMSFPKLTISTTSVSVSEPSTVLGTAIAVFVGVAMAMLRNKQR